MSEESIKNEVPASATSGSASVEAKITQGLSKIDGIVEKVLGVVGDHPWERWLSVGNSFIGKYLPFAIVLSGVLAFVLGLVFVIRYDMPISTVLSCFAILLVTAFSMHLSPKALALSRSFIEKGEDEAMRPELIYINKVICGLGGLVAAIFMLLQFNSDAFILAIILAVISLLSIIIYSNPGIVGVKADYPHNSVEEIITILMFPLKALLALLTPILGIAVVAGFVGGIVKLFDNSLIASIVLLGTAIVPLLLPVVVYFAYLILMFLFDICRSLVSIPRRLEDIRKAISDK